MAGWDFWSFLKKQSKLLQTVHVAVLRVAVLHALALQDILIPVKGLVQTVIQLVLVIAPPLVVAMVLAIGGRAELR